MAFNRCFTGFMFPNPGSFHSKYFIFVASLRGEGKKGEREIGVERRVWRLSSCCADKWWLASPPRRAEQQIAVASDDARSHPRPSAPAVNFTPVTSPLLLRGKRLRASGDYLNGKSEMAKCTFLHTYLEQFIPANVFICLFFTRR